MTQAAPHHDPTASPMRLWLALMLALLVALLPGPQAGGSQGQTWLTTATPALTAHHGREFAARKDAVQIRPLLASGIVPPDIAPPAPRLGGSVAYALVVWKNPLPQRCAPCARAPPSLS